MLPSIPDRPARIDLSAGSIHTVLVGGQPHVVLKPAIEDLGLDYSTQLRKLRERSWATVGQHPMVADDGKRRDMAIAPVRTFLMLLATINENRVAEAARPVLVAFQNETAEAIETYWTKGVAVNPRAVQPAGDDLDVIEGMVRALRAERQRITAIEQTTATTAARVDAIEGRHDWFTALGYAKLHDYPTERSFLSRVGRRAAALLRERGEQPHPRQDATFGQVNTYPVDVLARAFGQVSA